MEDDAANMRFLLLASHTRLLGMLAAFGQVVVMKHVPAKPILLQVGFARSCYCTVLGPHLHADYLHLPQAPAPLVAVTAEDSECACASLDV